MRFELLIIVITAFFIINTYYDGKFTKLLLSWKKYYQMIFWGVLGVSLYLLIKKNPLQSKKMLLYANNMVKYMPIDKTSMDMINPILDFTGGSMNRGFMQSSYEDEGEEDGNDLFLSRGEKRLLKSGGADDVGFKKATKRSVSETKKKYVAFQQNWKCGHCNSKLNPWFEVDHIQRLENGGSNEVTNLVALCRECHGKKTSMENM